MLSLVRETVRDPLLRAAWLRLLRLWRPMAAWTLVVWASMAVVLLPLSSGFVRWQLGRSERLVVGNEELLGWLLTPAGIAYVLATGTLLLAQTILRFAGLHQIIVDDLEHPPPSFRIIIFELAAQIPTLLRFSFKALALALALAAPVLAGLLAVYRLFLADHDINYYLSARPAAWYQALTAALVWLALSSVGAAYLFGRSVLALPAWLEGHRGMTAALRQSWALTRARAARLLRLLLVVLAGWALLRAVANAAFFALASITVGALMAASATTWPLLLAFAAFVGGTVGLNALIGFAGFSFLSTLLTKFYLENTPLHRPQPEFIPVPPLLAGLRPWLRLSRLLPLLALLLLGGGLFSQRLLQRLPEPADVVVIAHRGGPPPAPENTLAALERAIAAGAGMAEIDVLRTRDGTVVVAHDADLMRLARDPRRIAGHTYAALQSVVQLPDDGSPAAERRLATLGEFLERARGRIQLMIELKYYGPDPQLAPAVVHDVRARGMSAEVAIMSLDHQAVRHVRRLAPEISAGYVTTVALGAVTRLDVDFLAVNRSRITAALIRDAHAKGLRVHAWTVNDPLAMADLIDLGVHGLITDVPALAVRVRDELEQLSPVERLLLRFRQLLLVAPEPVSPANDEARGEMTDP